jgi:hypothetical protein
VGRIFNIIVNTATIANTATINNFVGTPLFINAQKGASYQVILLTNATTAGTWVISGQTTPTYDQVLGAGSTAVSKTAIINDGGSNSTALSATGYTATDITGNIAYSATGITQGAGSTAPLAITAISTRPLNLSGQSVNAPTVSPSTDSSTKVATTAFVQSAISSASISTTTQVASPVNLTTASTQNQVLTGSLAYTVNLPDATTLVVGRSFIINVNTNATANTATINNFTGTALVSNAQRGSIFECILLTNSTTAGTWDIHSFLPSSANFGSTGLVYQGNLTFTGSGTSVISQSGSGNISITAPTLTGVPLAPTATAGTNTTQIATTAFVQTAVGGATYDTVLANGNTATNKSAIITNGSSSTNTNTATAHTLVGASSTTTINDNSLTTAQSVNQTAQMNSNGAIVLGGTNVGYTTDAQVSITNNNSTAGNTVGVPTIHYYKAGRNGAVNDVVGAEIFYGNNYVGTKVEWGKIQASIRNTSSGADRGALSLFATSNGVSSEYLRCDGGSSLIVLSKGLNTGGNSILANSGNLVLDASGSAGTGSIIETLKAGGNLIINNLPTSSVGLPTNAVWRNGNVLNIV